MDRNLTILIAEDNANDVTILKRALGSAGIINPVQVVSDGVEAIEYLRGVGKYEDRSLYPFPSIIFTDLKMPRMGGFEILEWLRSHPDCSVIPIIVLSASKIDADIKRAYQMGANSYLVKPSRFEDLKQMVKTAFEYWVWCEKPALSGNC